MKWVTNATLDTVCWNNVTFILVLNNDKKKMKNWNSEALKDVLLDTPPSSSFMENLKQWPKFPAPGRLNFPACAELCQQVTGPTAGGWC